MLEKRRSPNEEQRAQEAHTVARALAGDVAAFGDLYEEYLDAIYHYIFYRVAGRQEAEDLTETVFLRAWQALEENPPREIPFRLWLYRIAHNAVVDHYRSRRQHVGLEAALDLPDPYEGPEATLVRRERANELRQALCELSDDYQEVLTCRFIVGLSHAETAVVMMRSEEATRALQYRAIVALRNLLTIQVGSYV